MRLVADLSVIFWLKYYPRSKVNRVGAPAYAKASAGAPKKSGLMVVGVRYASLIALAIFNRD